MPSTLSQRGRPFCRIPHLLSTPFFTFFSWPVDFASVAHRPAGLARLKEHSARKTEWRRVVRALPPVVVAEAGIYAYRPPRSTTFFQALRIFHTT
ncbi:hypothetical protein FVW27_10945 [Desulfovibrio sp. XJ01]|nr:hypothetical protein [Nitratidesulfovibrio liaohensis]